MKKLYSMILALSLPLGMSAQTSEALPFMQLDFQPASLAMGSSHVHSAATLPLGASPLDAGVAFETYMPAISATNYISGGVAGLLDKIGLSLGFTRGSGEPVTGEQFTPSEVLINVGASYAVLDWLAAGVNVKFAKEQLLSNYSNSAFAADMFVAGKVSEFDFAAGLSSVGQKVASSSTGSFSLPSAATVGCGYVYSEDILSICARAKADYYFSGAVAAGFGAEFCYSGTALVRAGYHYGGDSIIPSFASAGLGVRFREFTLDAAYLFASDILANSFAISAGVRF